MFLYEEHSTTFPILGPYRLVIGSDTVQNTGKSFPGVRLVKRNLSRDVKVEGFYHKKKIEEIHDSFEKWKNMHPEVNIPLIEMV